MKTTKLSNGLEVVIGLPKSITDAGRGNTARLLTGEKYRVIGFVPVPETRDKKGNVLFNAWTGVGIERLSTGTHIVMGVNALLGQSIHFAGIGANGASEKGYIVESVAGNCFTSEADFPANENGDNNTVFLVKAVKPLKANAVYMNKNAADFDANDPKYTETKMKDFYLCEIVEQSKEISSKVLTETL